MIVLSSKKGTILNKKQSEPIILKVSKNSSLPEVIRDKYAYFINGDESFIPSGFKAYLAKSSVNSDINVNDVYLLDEQMTYISSGDVVRLSPKTGGIRVLYRENSNHNYFLVTERCDNFCLMCSQPPRNIDDDYISKEILEVIPLMSRATKEIGITGGEPTIIGSNFFSIIKKLKSFLPETSVHILSNGRYFSDLNNAVKLAEINHPDIMIGIPLYSDLESVHDFVVQSKNAYNETIKGILNLKACGIAVELRVVVHKQTYKRLFELSEFIARNLTFVDQVAFMGLEFMGFAKSNINALWIDPYEYQNQLKKAVLHLNDFRIKASIYNHQLCILNKDLHRFNVRSISDWKNEYIDKCSSCMKIDQCGGFFSSTVEKHSEYITPFAL